MAKHAPGPFGMKMIESDPEIPLLPWRAEPCDDTAGTALLDARGETIFEGYDYDDGPGNWRVTVEHIARAVNAYKGGE